MEKIKLNLNFKSRENTNPVINGSIEYFFIYDNSLKLIDQKIYLNYEKNQIVSNLGASGFVFNKNKNKDAYYLRKYIIENSLKTGRKTRGGYDILDIPFNLISYINSKLDNHVNLIMKLNSFLSGSNVSGSFSNINNTPYVISPSYSTDGFYDNYRFVHIFKKLECSENYQYDIKDFKEISFNKFLDKYNLRSTFEVYNRDIINVENGRTIPEDWMNELSTSLGIKINTEEIDRIVKENEEREWKKSDRNKIRFNVLNRFSKEKADQIFGIYPIDLMECAHIYNVKDIDIKKEGNFINDPDNGIMMHDTMHKAFDRNWFTFNTKGDLIFNPNINFNKNLILNGKKDVNIHELLKKYPKMKFFIEKRNEKLNWV